MPTRPKRGPADSKGKKIQARYFPYPTANIYHFKAAQAHPPAEISQIKPIFLNMCPLGWLGRQQVILSASPTLRFKTVPGRPASTSWLSASTGVPETAFHRPNPGQLRLMGGSEPVKSCWEPRRWWRRRTWLLNSDYR